MGDLVTGLSTFKSRLLDFGNLKKLTEVKCWEFTEDYLNEKEETQTEGKVRISNNIVCHKTDQYGQVRMMPNPMDVKAARKGILEFKLKLNANKKERYKEILLKKVHKICINFNTDFTRKSNNFFQVGH